MFKKGDTGCYPYGNCSTKKRLGTITNIIQFRKQGKIRIVIEITYDNKKKGLFNQDKLKKSI